MEPTALSSDLGLPIVYLVDDEDVVRDAVAWLLRSRRLLSEGYASAEAFEAMVMARHGADESTWPNGPACLLLDLRMSGMSGLALFKRLKEQRLTDAVPVIFLTGHADVPTAVEAVKRGAFDFVEKPFSNNALVDRIEEALRLSAEALHDRRVRTTRKRRLDDLTEREREVLAIMAEGRSNQAICRRLYLSPKTVESYVRSVFTKLGLQLGTDDNRRVLAVLAFLRG